jgi:hypothetical protein
MQTSSDWPVILQLAQQLAQAGEMIPKHFRGEPGKILAAVLTGRELGVEPMAAMRAFHIVEGKPCADYSFWCARLKQSGYIVEWPQSDGRSATVKLTDQRTGASFTSTYTLEMAQRAGLTGKNNWKNYPEVMLRARALTSAGRAFAGEVMFGCYETDEADEIRQGVEPTPLPVTSERGVAGLTQRLSVTVVDPTPVDNPLETDKKPDAAEPEPFGLSEEAVAAIQSCGTLDDLRIVRDRCKASKFRGGDGEAVKAALQAQVDKIKEDDARKAEAVQP